MNKNRLFYDGPQDTKSIDRFSSSRSLDHPKEQSYSIARNKGSSWYLIPNKKKIFHGATSRCCFKVDTTHTKKVHNSSKSKNEAPGRSNIPIRIGNRSNTPQARSAQAASWRTDYDLNLKPERPSRYRPRLKKHFKHN